MSLDTDRIERDVEAAVGADTASIAERVRAITLAALTEGRLDSEALRGVMNAVLVRGDAVGQSLFYGAGAGAEPTASAVVADIIDVVRTLTVDPDNRVPHLAFQPDALSDLPVLPMAEVETCYYLRLQAVDRSGVLADVTRILADRDISIEAVLQKEPPPGARDVPIILLTYRVREQRMNEAIAAIEALDSIHAPVVRIRMEHLNSD